MPHFTREDLVPHTYSTNPALSIAELKLDCARAAPCSSMPSCSHTPSMSSGWLAAASGCPCPGGAATGFFLVGAKWTHRKKEPGRDIMKKQGAWVGKRRDVSHKETPGFPPALDPAWGWMRVGARDLLCWVRLWWLWAGSAFLHFCLWEKPKSRDTPFCDWLSCQTPTRLAQTYLVAPSEVLRRARDLPRLVRMIRQTCPSMGISAHNTQGDHVHPVRGFMDIKAEGELRKADDLSQLHE